MTLRDRVCAWLGQHRRVCVATIVKAQGSAPFGAGKMMAITDAREVFGTISNGCVESELAEIAMQVFAHGKPVERSFDSTGDGLYDVSMPCGGSIDVRIEEITADDVARIFEHEGSSAHLILAGGNDHALALAEFCIALRYDVTIVDPRPAFSRKEDFNGAAVVCAWPDEFLAESPLGAQDAALLLSHDTRYDVAFLAQALASDAFYVGALGSRRTQEHRTERLIAAGVSRAELARLHAPIGLDLGGRSPHETAVAILAELIAVRNHRAAVPLKDHRGPIHDPHPDTATLPGLPACAASNLHDRATS